MHRHSSTKLILSLTIIIVLFVSVAYPEDKTFTVKQKITQQSNPTPENIQILGVADQQNTNVATESIAFDTEKLYGLVNSYRQENNLQKLFANKLLENSAQKKLTDMIENNYFRHTDSNENESWYLFQESGYQYKYAGENLSSGNNSPWQVFSAWQTSPEHNQQLLKAEYLDMGIAVDCEVYKIRNKPACITVLHLGTR